MNLSRKPSVNWRTFFVCVCDRLCKRTTYDNHVVAQIGHRRASDVGNGNHSLHLKRRKIRDTKTSIVFVCFKLCMWPLVSFESAQPCTSATERADNENAVNIGQVTIARRAYIRQQNETRRQFRAAEYARHNDGLCAREQTETDSARRRPSEKKKTCLPDGKEKTGCSC